MDRDLVVAIDLGGTRIRAALVNSAGKVLDRRSLPTLAGEGRDSVIERILMAANQIIQTVGSERLSAIGIGAPGPLDFRTGVVMSAPNLPGWHDVPLRSIMEASLGLPVVLGNDANLAAFGEATNGAGKGTDNLIYITVSTGIGGGVVVDGKLLLGERGLAAEVGHMAIEAFGPTCSCGNVGCLEALASGTAIARKARERIAAGCQTIISTLLAEQGGEITARMVVEAAKQDDRLAKEIMEAAATYLGVGVVNLLHLFNPKMVILGGGVSHAGNLLFDPVKRVVAARAMPAYTEGLTITPAALGDDAGLLGAAALALTSPV
ncbi:MAG: ROK family protein [Dehalococcoidia bacterium]|nr:ROK family protein [Dehalococcoidia bacterium]